MQRSTHHSQQWDGWGSDRPLRPSSPSLTLLPLAPLLLSIRSLRISKQGPSSLAYLHSSVVMQELLPKMRTLALHLPGSPLGLHTWSPPHCKPCRMSGEQVSLLCGALSPLPDVSLHHLSWCRQSTALLSEADATAGCHCLHFKIRKAWGDRKAEISATSYEELGFCFCCFF